MRRTKRHPRNRKSGRCGPAGGPDDCGYWPPSFFSVSPAGAAAGTSAEADTLRARAQRVVRRRERFMASPQPRPGRQGLPSPTDGETPDLPTRRLTGYPSMAIGIARRQGFVGEFFRIAVGGWQARSRATGGQQWSGGRSSPNSRGPHHRSRGSSAKSGEWSGATHLELHGTAYVRSLRRSRKGGQECPRSLMSLRNRFGPLPILATGFRNSFGQLPVLATGFLNRFGQLPNLATGFRNSFGQLPILALSLLIGFLTCQNGHSQS